MEIIIPQFHPYFYVAWTVGKTRGNLRSENPPAEFPIAMELDGVKLGDGDIVFPEMHEAIITFLGGRYVKVELQGIKEPFFGVRQGGTSLGITATTREWDLHHGLNYFDNREKKWHGMGDLEMGDIPPSRQESQDQRRTLTKSVKAKSAKKQKTVSGKLTSPNKQESAITRRKESKRQEAAGTKRSPRRKSASTKKKKSMMRQSKKRKKAKREKS